MKYSGASGIPRQCEDLPKFSLFDEWFVVCTIVVPYEMLVLRHLRIYLRFIEVEIEKPLVVVIVMNVYMKSGREVPRVVLRRPLIVDDVTRSRPRIMPNGVRR